MVQRTCSRSQRAGAAGAFVCQDECEGCLRRQERCVDELRQCAGSRSRMIAFLISLCSMLYKHPGQRAKSNVGIAYVLW